MESNPLQAALSHSQIFMPEVGSPPQLIISSAEEFLKGPPPARKYLLGNTLPLGEVGMIVGASGIGKSMFTHQLGLAVANGSPVCGGLYEVEHPGGVLMVNAEDDQAELHRRTWSLFHAYKSGLFNSLVSGADTLSEEILNNFSSLMFCSLKGQPCGLIDEYGEVHPIYDQIQYAASQISGLRLIVLDPLRRMYEGNEDSSDMAARFIPLTEKLAKDTGATVLLVHHLSKHSSRQGSLDQYAAKGSGAFTDLVRWQLNIATPKNLDGTGLPKERKREYLEVSVSKNNYGPLQPDRLFLHRGEHGVLQYVHPSGLHDKLDDEVGPVVAVIGSQFKTGKVYSRSELKTHGKALGIALSHNALRKAIDRAIQKDLLIEVPRPKYKAKGKTPKDLLPYGTVHPSSG